MRFVKIFTNLPLQLDVIRLTYPHTRAKSKIYFKKILDFSKKLVYNIITKDKEKKGNPK